MSPMRPSTVFPGGRWPAGGFPTTLESTGLHLFATKLRSRGRCEHEHAGRRRRSLGGRDIGGPRCCGPAAGGRAGADRGGRLLCRDLLGLAGLVGPGAPAPGGGAGAGIGRPGAASGGGPRSVGPGLRPRRRVDPTADPRAEGRRCARPRGGGRIAGPAQLERDRHGDRRGRGPVRDDGPDRDAEGPRCPGAGGGHDVVGRDRHGRDRARPAGRNPPAAKKASAPLIDLDAVAAVLEGAWTAPMPRCAWR